MSWRDLAGFEDQVLRHGVVDADGFLRQRQVLRVVDGLVRHELLRGVGARDHSKAAQHYSLDL